MKFPPKRLVLTCAKSGLLGILTAIAVSAPHVALIELWRDAPIRIVVLNLCVGAIAVSVLAAWSAVQLIRPTPLPAIIVVSFDEAPDAEAIESVQAFRAHLDRLLRAGRIGHIPPGEYRPGTQAANAADLPDPDATFGVARPDAAAGPAGDPELGTS